MELIKAYANKVASFLPVKQRESMRDEIFADLCDEFEEYQTSEEAFLADKPHPMKYAGQLVEPNYGYLIGPQFYFSYIETLKGIAAIISLMFTGFAVVEIATSQTLVGPIIDLFYNTVYAMLWITAAVTGIFIALERTGERARWLDSWNIDSLKQWQSSYTISRTTIAFELGMSVVLLAWLLGFIEFPTFVWYEGQRLDDWQLFIGDGLRYAFVALLLVDIVQGVWQYLEPVWSKWKRWIRIETNVVWIIALIVAWLQPNKVQFLLADMSDNLVTLEQLLNQVLNWGLLGVAALLLIDSASLLIKGRKVS